MIVVLTNKVYAHVIAERMFLDLGVDAVAYLNERHPRWMYTIALSREPKDTRVGERKSESGVEFMLLAPGKATRTYVVRKRWRAVVRSKTRLTDEQLRSLAEELLK